MKICNQAYCKGNIEKLIWDKVALGTYKGYVIKVDFWMANVLLKDGNNAD
ncbi:MAG: hypothetical protein QNK26_14595 [Moritella sp.]|nr:hypothetical protein [Moritella sp.]MDX2321812.1 hypothetical protein [Moritella sp.]